MATPKRQHFSPRLHLKHFIGPEPKGQIWTYDKQTGSMRSATPENTGVETHFYSVRSEDGGVDTSIEEFLAQGESKAAPIYERLLRGELPTDPQERVEFSEFLALMYCRNPAARRMAGELIGQFMQITSYAYGSNPRALDSLLAERAQREGVPIPDAEAKEKLRNALLDPSGFEFQIPRERTLMALGAADKLAPIFFEMKWTIVRPRHGFFVTTDNPLIREVDPKSRHPLFGDHGFWNKTAAVAFPLSPQHLLLLKWNEGAPDTTTVGRDFVDGVNRSLIARADRYVYAHIRHKQIQKLAIKFKDSRPEFVSRGFGPRKYGKVRVIR